MAKMQKAANDGSSVYRSVAALAEDLHLCERSVRVALRRGEIPHLKVGKRFVLPKAAIRRWLKEAGGAASSL
jgi:excisionase family DNA binding protein